MSGNASVSFSILQAYLPDSEAGVKMLHGVYIAWAQRVMFTVGRSVTTGRVSLSVVNGFKF